MRRVNRDMPELAGGLHLDRYGRVTALADAPEEGSSCERFRPRYAVDIVILTPELEPDPAFPPYTAVPLPVPLGAGQESGAYAYPQPGAIVVVGFVYGRQDHPVIRQAYPLGASLPQVRPGEWVAQQGPAVFQKADADGNWTRATDAAITDDSISRLVKAVDGVTELAREVKRISEHSTVEVGGMATLEAGTLLTLLAGLRADIGTLGDLHISAGGDSTRSTAGRDTETVGGNQHSTIKGDRRAGIAGSQSLEIGGEQTVTVGGNSAETVAGDKTIQAANIALRAAGTLSLTSSKGGGNVSLFGELLAGLDDIKAALDTLAAHDHPNAGTINQGGSVASNSASLGAHRGTMGGITE